jgi:hypothetical protein
MRLALAGNLSPRPPVLPRSGLDRPRLGLDTGACEIKAAGPYKFIGFGAITLGFSIHGFWAGRKSPIFGVWAAGSKTHSKRWGASPPTFWNGVWGRQGRPDPKNRPKCKFIGSGAINVTKPYIFIWFGVIQGPKPYNFLWSGGFYFADTGVCPFRPGCCVSW